MVSRIEVIPSEVRGYGNIVEAKSLSDFVPVESDLVFSENVYSLTALTGVRISLTASSSSISVGSSVTLSATVMDDNTPVTGGTVSFYDGETLLGAEDTDSDGVAAYTTSSLTLGGHSLSAVYDEYTSNVVTVTVSDVPSYDGVSLTSDKSILSYADSDTCTLTAQLLDGSSSASVSGVTVEFFNGSTSLGTAETNASGVATKTYSSTGAGDISLTAEADTYTSEPVSIEDCSRFDDASTDKSSSYSSANLSSLTHSVDHYEAYRSLGSSPTSTFYSPIYVDETLPTDFEISVDISSSTVTNSFQNMISIASSHLQTYSGATEMGLTSTLARNSVFSRTNGTGSFADNNNQNLSTNTYYNYLVKVEGTTVTATIKDMQGNTKYSNNMTVSFAQNLKKWSIIVGDSAHTLKWKNLKIKPL